MMALVLLRKSQGPHFFKKRLFFSIGLFLWGDLGEIHSPANYQSRDLVLFSAAFLTPRKCLLK